MTKYLTPFMLFSRFAMLDIVLKLMSEMLGKTAHGEHGGVGQGADGAAGHIVADGIKQFQIFGFAFAAGDAVHDAVEPAGAFAAGGALAAGFFVVEIA